MDGLTGFPDAIKGVFPKSDIQLCIVHLVLNSLKYVSWKYRKELARDLKEIYHAGTLEEAEAALIRLGEKWNEKSPCNICALGTQLVEHNNNLHVPNGDKTSDIYYQRDRVAQRGNPEPYQDQVDTRQR